MTSLPNRLLTAAITSDDTADNNNNEPYIPEYELESVTFVIPNTNNNNDNNTKKIGSVAVTFEVYTIVPPPIEYMSTLYNNHTEISGRKLWCGSILLSQYILHRHRTTSTSDFHNKRILELGSGTGIVGMVLAYISSIRPSDQRRPSCLILTDGEPTSVELMKQNILHAQNKNPQQHCYASCVDTILFTTCMKWGDTDEQQNLRFQQECFTQFPHLFNSLSSTSTDDSKKKDIEFDYILAGDVLYKEELPTLFFQTVHKYLTRNYYTKMEEEDDEEDENRTTKERRGEGYLLLCHVPRASVTHDFVLKVAMEYGFHVMETIDISSFPFTIPDSCPFEDAQRACIYKMYLKE